MIRLRSLGEAVFEVGDSTITPGAPLRFAALLYFVVERGKRISRQSLTGMLWPAVAEAGGRHSLRHMLYMLRGMGVEFADGPHDVELVADRVAIDYEMVLREPVTAAQEIGDFLPGYSPSWSQGFADWLEQLRARVNGRFRTAILRALAEAKGHGQWTNVEQLARQCLRFDPLNEEATLAFAEATALSGGKAAAVAILDRYLTELGATPRELKLPASVLRTRIAERLPAPYNAAADSCFVGREDIMAELTMHLNRARAGLGAGCYVWGSAGIGKSRAVLELMRVAALQGLRPVRVTCQPSDVRRPLSAFRRPRAGAAGAAGGFGMFTDVAPVSRAPDAIATGGSVDRGRRSRGRIPVRQPAAESVRSHRRRIRRAYAVHDRRGCALAGPGVGRCVAGAD